MRYARVVVLVGGALASFAFLLVGLRDAFVPADDMIFSGVFVALGTPVVIAAALVRKGRVFRVYALAGLVACVAIGGYLAAGDHGFPRSMLVLAATYAVAAALPAGGDELPGWLPPAAQVAGALIVFAVVAPSLAWQDRNPVDVCTRTAADANHLTATGLRHGVEGIESLPDRPTCVRVVFKSGVPPHTADTLTTRLRHDTTVTSITPA